MASKEESPNDLWNIVDLIGRLISSILISGVLGYFIQKGAQEISFSIETGKLTQSLISKLASTKKEEQLKQDIALAALDGSIGSRNPYLVSSVAERIYMSKPGFTDPTAQYALQVLKVRNEPKYQEIRTANLNFIVSQTSKSQSGSTPDSPAIVNKSTEQIDVVSQVISRTFTGVVFVQFKNNKLKNTSERIKNGLLEQGLEVPPLEQVNANYSNSIRYFNPEDVDLAIRVKAVIENIVEEPKQKFEVLDFSKSGYKIPKGQIEIWIGN